MQMTLEQINVAGEAVGTAMALEVFGGIGITATEQSDIALANEHRQTQESNAHGETPESIGAEPAGAVDTAIGTIKGAVTDAYDTLEKIEAYLQSVDLVLQSNDLNLDHVQEIVDYIKDNASDIAELVIGKADKSSIVDNLLSTDAAKILSANQGRVLMALIDTLTGQLGGHTVGADVPSDAVFNSTLPALALAANILTYTDGQGTQHQFDLSIYLDDTNLARLVSGKLDGATGIATFTRDDATTFTIDFSSLLDDTRVTVTDNLTSTATDEALSAKQGNVLNTQHIALMETWAGSERNPIIYDDFGDANNMVMIPKFRVEDIDASLGTGVHPAFIVNGVEKDAIYIGKYQASAKGSNFVSVPNANPATYINFDQALAACAAKGNGWHLMTNAEWSAVALWSRKNGTIPRGNNNYGCDITYKNETGRLTNAAAVLGSSGTARTATGSGPATWSHDHTPDGIFDLNGNVHEWVGGFRIVDGEIQVLADNDAADNTKDQSDVSTLWRAIASAGGSLVDPGAGGTLKYDATGETGAGSVQIDTVIDSQSDGTTYAAGEFESMAADAGITVPERMLQLGLAPAGSALGGDYIYVRNVGERLPLRGGSWGNGAYAGVFRLSLAYARSSASSDTGFRPAFVL